MAAHSIVFPTTFLIHTCAENFMHLDTCIMLYTTGYIVRTSKFVRKVNTKSIYVVVDKNVQKSFGTHLEHKTGCPHNEVYCVIPHKYPSGRKFPTNRLESKNHAKRYKKKEAGTAI